MKVTIINGSYHKNGMISQLVENFISGFKSGLKNIESAEIINYFLKDKNIEYCLGCHSCDKSPGELIIAECAVKDDVRPILDDLTSSDVIIFASPVYAYGVTAVMKKFIERSIVLADPEKGIFVSRIKKKKGRMGVIITSTGCPPVINTILKFNRYPKFILKFLCKLLGCGKKYVISAGAMESSEKMKKRFLDKSFKLGQKLSGKPL